MTTQTLLALGIISALFVTGRIIELVIGFNASVVAFISGSAASAKVEVPHLLRTATFAIGITTLGGVLLSVQVLRWLFAPKITAAVTPALKPKPAQAKRVA